MTAGEIIKQLNDAGWVECDTRGLHIQFKHPSRPGKVTVPSHSGDRGTRNSILKQAGLK